MKIYVIVLLMVIIERSNNEKINFDSVFEFWFCSATISISRIKV